MVPAYFNASAQITLFNCAETFDFAIYPDQNYNPALSRSQSRALKASHYTRNLCGKWPKSDHVCEQRSARAAGISPQVRSRRGHSFGIDHANEFSRLLRFEISSQRAEEITHRCIHEHKTRSVGGCYFRERPPYLVIEIAVPYTPHTHTHKSLSLSLTPAQCTGLAQIAFCDTRCENKFMTV